MRTTAKVKRHASTLTALANNAVKHGEDEPERTKGTGRITNQFGLTEKQEDYARHVANGLTLRDAYEKSYDASAMKVTTIYTQASQLLDNPLIAKRVRELMDERQSKTHAIDAKRIRQHVFDRLMVESLEAREASARIRALELLGKIDIVSMFTESKGPLESIDTADSLRAKLQAMLDKMIDISPNKVRK